MQHSFCTDLFCETQLLLFTNDTFIYFDAGYPTTAVFLGFGKAILTPKCSYQLSVSFNDAVNLFIPTTLHPPYGLFYLQCLGGTVLAPLLFLLISTIFHFKFLPPFAFL